MIIRHKSPETAVGRIVTVVAHHPVIIKFKCISIGFLTIDVNFSVSDFQRIELVSIYNARINGQVGQGKLYGGAGFRDIKRSEVVYVPGICRIERENIGLPESFWLNDFFNRKYIWKRFEFGYRLLAGELFLFTKK